MSDQIPTLLPTTPPELPPSRGSSPVTWVVSLLLASILGSLLFAGGYLAAGGASRAGTCAAPSEAFEALCEAYDKLKKQFVDRLDDTELAEGAIRGLFEYGVKDPFSGYMSPDEYQRALGSLSGEFTGIGAEMAVKNLENPDDLAACTQLSETCALVVVAPLADSPAEAAGLQSGDIIQAVDGVSVNGSTLQDQVGKVRGESGTEVTLTIKRGERTFDLSITRAKIVQREVTSEMLDGKIGYIGLHGFSPASSEQFHTALGALLDDGAVSIIFDLRDNPGGYIDAAQKIASEFIGSGLIFSQESSGGDKKDWSSTGDGLATDEDLPLAVLVNGGSASASE
ncbi:MAG TPA: S41 family peptidase, partial [Candidatus Limnocylindria bacterium]|nr:S41 family peptidase [Candidatus Limnocylindria bacterium]